MPSKRHSWFGYNLAYNFPGSGIFFYGKDEGFNKIMALLYVILFSLLLNVVSPFKLLSPEVRGDAHVWSRHKEGLSSSRIRSLRDISVLQMLQS